MIEGVNEAAAVGEVVVALRICATDSVLTNGILHHAAVDRANRVHRERAWCLAGEDGSRGIDAECHEKRDDEQHCSGLLAVLWSLEESVFGSGC